MRFVLLVILAGLLPALSSAQPSTQNRKALMPFYHGVVRLIHGDLTPGLPTGMIKIGFADADKNGKEIGHQHIGLMDKRFPIKIGDHVVTWHHMIGINAPRGSDREPEMSSFYIVMPLQEFLKYNKFEFIKEKPQDAPTPPILAENKI